MIIKEKEKGKQEMRLEKGIVLFLYWLIFTQQFDTIYSTNPNLAKEYDFMKKLIPLVLVLVCVVSFFGCNNKTIPNLNPNNETGWTVRHGIYVKTELGHDVLVVETENSEEMYIFMTFTEECDVPNNLQTGDKLAIKIVIIYNTDGVNTTQVFELAQYGDSPESVDSEVLSEIEALSQKLANADATKSRHLDPPMSHSISA